MIYYWYLNEVNAMNPPNSSPRRKTMRRILDYMALHTEASRSTLSEALDLSPATVTNLVTELMEKGLLVDGRQTQAAVGRKTTMLRFNAELRYVLTVSFEKKNDGGATTDRRLELNICDLLGRSQAHGSDFCNLLVSKTRSESAILQDLIRAIRAFLDRQPEALRQKTAAVGVCFNGMVNADQTVSTAFYNLNNLNLAAPLQAALGLPVYVDGVTHIKALYEMRFLDPADRNILYLNLSTGIGMAHIYEGKVLTGRHGIAGEVGHMSLNLFGPPCYCGNRGCFEYYCGTYSLLEQAAALLTPENQNDVFCRLAETQPLTPALLLQAWEQGSLLISELLRRVATYLGAALATLYNVYDPDRVIIASYLGEGDNALIELAKIEAKSRIVNTFSRDIVISRDHLQQDQLYLATSAFVLGNILDSLY